MKSYLNLYRLTALTTAVVFVSLSTRFQSLAQQKEDFTWPNGAKAAICLTYDDGLVSHVNTVGPALNKYNFKGTFFVTLGSPSVKEDIEKWRSLAKEGHELANHTVYHPCRKSRPGRDWVAEHHDLDGYTLPQILEEVKVANNFLFALDGDQMPRTFAYPCGDVHAGGASFTDSLGGYVSAARDVWNYDAALPAAADIDLFRVSSWAPNGNEGRELIAYVEKVVESNTLSTFTFHGVGAEHLAVSKEAHEELLQYLDAHRDKVWVTTFREATDYLREKRGR